MSKKQYFVQHYPAENMQRDFSLTFCMQVGTVLGCMDESRTSGSVWYLCGTVELVMFERWKLGAVFD